MFITQGLNYQCRWCNKIFKNGRQSYWNLWGHRDGSANRPACKNRHRAIESGRKLPPTYHEQNKKSQDSTLTSFVTGPTFTVELLNMILVLWIIRHTLPWARFEDPALRTAFYSVNRGAVVRSSTWAAQQSVQLFGALHDKAINTLKVSFTCLPF